MFVVVVNVAKRIDRPNDPYGGGRHTQFSPTWRRYGSMQFSLLKNTDVFVAECSSKLYSARNVFRYGGVWVCEIDLRGGVLISDAFLDKYLEATGYNLGGIFTMKRRTLSLSIF